MKPVDSVVLEESWPLLVSDPLWRGGLAWGVIRSVEHGLAPWRPLEHQRARGVRDWHAYYSVELQNDLPPQLSRSVCPILQAAIINYRRLRGHLPRVVMPCRYEVGQNNQPVRPRPSSKIYQLLRLVTPTRLLMTVRFDAPVGWEVLVRVENSKRDRAGDPKPQRLWRSTVLKVLAAHSPNSFFSFKFPATSSQQLASSEERDLPPEDVKEQGVAAARFPVSSSNQTEERASGPEVEGSLPTTSGPNTGPNVSSVAADPSVVELLSIFGGSIVAVPSPNGDRPRRPGSPF